MSSAAETRHSVGGKISYSLESLSRLALEMTGRLPTGHVGEKIRSTADLRTIERAVLPTCASAIQ